MKYPNIYKAIFLSRPNRFVAEVKINGKIEIVHVKNTGRCKELLVSGCEVWLTAPKTTGRKTQYDLVAVRKNNGKIFNIDSQAPNKLVLEWLIKQKSLKITPEYSYGNSRLDFYIEKETDSQTQKIFMEVKGCTLEVDGVGYFPDAPTTRGIKHIRELIRAKAMGYRAILAYVIQVDGVKEVLPNWQTHKEYGEAIDDAIAAGVEILFLKCHVTPDELNIVNAQIL